MTDLALLEAIDEQRLRLGLGCSMPIRIGYHRGLDALRRNGWKGHGPVPWEHEPNRGFLRCLNALARAAAAINETEEAQRCQQFLVDSSPAAADALS